MKPFDLGKALAGDPVITGDGAEVTEFHLFTTCVKAYPLYACVNGSVGSYTSKGKYLKGKTSPHDLYMKPKEVTVWTTFWDDDGEIRSTGYPTEEGAHANTRYYRKVLCIKPITITL